MRTSYSALETFKVCPLKYKYSQIDKLKEPKRIESVFGTLVHSALKYMFERNPLYPTEDEIIDFFTKKWNEKSELIEWKDPEKKEAAEKLYYAEGVKIIKNFYKKNPPWNFNVIEMEGRFSLPLLDETTGEEHTLAGIIDRVDKDPNSEVYEIIDYKTGKTMPSAASLAENLQLGLYHLALSVRWPHVKPENITISLYFLKHNDKVSTIVSEAVRTRMKENVLETIREIQERTKSGDFPAHVNPLCGYCGFRKICPMWSHEYTREEKKADPTEQELSQALQEFFEIKNAENENDKRIKELREIITSYMDANKVERVFGDEGSLSRTVTERYSFDMGKIQPILEHIGKWNDVLDPDEKKLQKLMVSLPPEIQKEILAFRERKTSVMLKQGKK